jgi:hypothetical protein
MQENLEWIPEIKRDIARRKAAASSQQRRAIREARALDAWFFATHPDLDSYWRFYIEGEFGDLEVPEPEPGWHKAVHVSRTRWSPDRKPFDIRIPSWA